MSTIRKRSVSLNGHRTSYSIEDEFQMALVEIADSQSLSLAELIAMVDRARGAQSNLSSELRIMALNYYRVEANHTNSKTAR